MTGVLQHQTTLAGTVSFSGISVHRGEEASVILHPAPPDHGLQFQLNFTANARKVTLAAHADFVSDSTLGTQLTDPATSQSVNVTEHILSALYGMEIDNAVIEVSMPELPVLDGSALPFAEAIDKLGKEEQTQLRRYLKIKKTVQDQQAASTGKFSPASGFELDITTIYKDPVIGTQHFCGILDPAFFIKEIAPARTFGFANELETLHAMGRGKGASLDNVLAFENGQILNPEGAHFEDEPVRHKALDAIGDLALLGFPLLGRYEALRPGHRFNLQMIKKLLANPDAWELVTLPNRG